MTVLVRYLVPTLLCGMAAQPAWGRDFTETADSAVVEGIVYDAVTSHPLPGALVRVVGLARQDVTHENGEFHLLNLPAGRHTLLFERPGYRRETRVVEVERRQTVELQVEMRPSVIALPGIMVTGAARAGLGDQAVRPANVVAGQELARKLDVTIASTLQHEPGLAVTSIGPATGRPVIRGLGGDRVLVLEDGTRTGDLSAGSPDHALTVDPVNVQRIEVVRGPAALLYGSNAIGGVINVIREEVPATLPERASGILSAQGQSVNAGGTAGGSVQLAAGSRVAIRADGSYRTAGDLRTPEGTLANTGLRTYSLSAGASRVGPRGHIGASYRYYDNVYGIPGGFVGSHPEGVDVEVRRHSVLAQAHIGRPVGPFSGIELDGRYTNYYHRELEAADIVGTEFGMLTASADLLARHERWGPFSSGAAGGRVGWQDYAAGGGTETPPSRAWTAAVFLLEELDVGRARIQGGVRLDWSRIVPGDTTTELDIGVVRTRTFGSFSASLGALYALTPYLSAGASIGRAFRTPDTGELFSQGPHLAAYSFEVGNPDLSAETGLGLDAFLRLHGDRYRGELAVFRNAIDNYIYYRETGGTDAVSGLPIYQAASADAVLEGFEVSGSIEPVRNLGLTAVASYVRGTETGDARPLPTIPPLHGLITARYERPGYFVGGTWRAVAAQDRVATHDFEPRTPGHHLFDAEAGIRWVALGRVQSLTMRLENLADRAAYDHLSRIRRRDAGSDTERRAAGAGRGASLTYRMVF
jgi:iron complex outermembrane recepter protein